MLANEMGSNPTLFLLLKLGRKIHVNILHINLCLPQLVSSLALSFHLSGQRIQFPLHGRVQAEERVIVYE